GPAENAKYQDRWKTKEGVVIKHHILKLLREGTTEHFLQKDFIDNNLPILESETDLKGLHMIDENVKDHHAKTLTNVDLSYSFIAHSKFENMTFPNMGFRFATLRDV